jgi:peptide deformylase
VIPESLGEKLAELPGAKELHEEALETQNTVIGSAAEQIGQQAGVYVLSLENQIERLKKDDAQAAIDVIEAEIARVKDQEGYFISLFR